MWWFEGNWPRETCRGRDVEREDGKLSSEGRWELLLWRVACAPRSAIVRLQRDSFTYSHRQGVKSRN